MKRGAALGLVVGLFLLGGVVGALTTHLIYARQAPPPEEPTLLRPPPFLRHLERRLELDAEQRQEIGSILEDSHRRMEAVRREAAPEMRSIYRDTTERIETVLTPEQRDTWREMRSRRSARWERFLGDRHRHRDGHRSERPRRRRDRHPDAPQAPPAEPPGS